MALISANKRIAIETLKNTDDELKQNLILPLNQLNEQVVNALDGQLSINDNMTSHIITQKLTHRALAVISNPLSIKPRGAVAIYSDGLPIEYLTLTFQSSQSLLGLTVSFIGGSSTDEATVTILMVGG